MPSAGLVLSGQGWLIELNSELINMEKMAFTKNLITQELCKFE